MHRLHTAERNGNTDILHHLCQSHTAARNGNTDMLVLRHLLLRVFLPMWEILAVDRRRRSEGVPGRGDARSLPWTTSGSERNEAATEADHKLCT